MYEFERSFGSVDQLADNMDLLNDLEREIRLRRVKPEDAAKVCFLWTVSELRLLFIADRAFTQNPSEILLPPGEVVTEGSIKDMVSGNLQIMLNAVMDARTGNYRKLKKHLLYKAELYMLEEEHTKKEVEFGNTLHALVGNIPDTGEELEIPSRPNY